MTIVSTTMAIQMMITLKLSEKCLHYYKTADICLDNGTFYCSKDSKAKSVIVAATVSEAVGAGILLFVVYCYRFKLFGFWKNRSKAHQDFEAFLKSHRPLAVVLEGFGFPTAFLYWVVVYVETDKYFINGSLEG
ncbi:hypothetical protein L6164_001707 [Bauhinia variegata]|uniref:Uncharacterized protein n=1 Tax=Bauhinia variegata TaxID=167791 RepID=A0ACB9QDL0_BAUVA|nr:hypothetical protein L6164_001707 [Bauhinia variegata]